jgi:DNA-binding response OmpR family regulator
MGEKKMIELNSSTCTVNADGVRNHLTPKEYGILSFLMEHPEQTCSPEEIYRSVWQEIPFACRPIISVHVRHLRKK